ncbi:MAG: hypothetical protein ABSH41_23725 [Syntrophobacteraceae bacterium]|jgi:hypothetical protein
MMIGIDQLWHFGTSDQWSARLDHYWTLLRSDNFELEKEMNSLDIEDDIRPLNPQDWYNFLLKKYFRWKYTAPNRYKTTTEAPKGLKQYAAEKSGLNELHRIMKQLLEFNQEDILEGLSIASEIKGLGTAGASGLLSVLYPQKFGTADQFVVKALRDVRRLPEAQDIARMNPEGLSLN